MKTTYLTQEDKSQIIEKYAPDKCWLYHVDYCDNLNEHIDWLEECIQSNSLTPLSERTYDLWHYPEAYELGEIESAMKRDGIGELFNELYDDFREWLWDHDESDPVKDVLRNTDDLVFFYSLGQEIEGYSEPDILCPSRRTTKEEDEVNKILKTLNLPANHPSIKDIEVMVAEAYYGGELRIYFSASVEDLITEPEYDNKSEDFKSVHIKGDVCICILNPWNGSGDMCEVKNVDVVIPFDRENLHISRIEKYGVEEVFGMYDNWAKGYDAPTFSMTPTPKKATIAKSSVNEALKVEAEYIKVFKSGKCSYGDMDVRRHRNVYYRNDFPCGNVCPHCGTFWID